LKQNWERNLDRKQEVRSKRQEVRKERLNE